MRRYHDEVEAMEFRRNVADLPLFAPAPPSGHAKIIGEAAKERATSHNVELLEALIPVAQLVAVRDGFVTVTDVRKEAQRRGILTGTETREQLSALGSLMQAAGLVATGEYRASDLDSTHARPQRVWRMP